MKTAEEFVEIIKTEVREDVKQGNVPTDVETFADLNDYVDANEYGGFCEMDWFDGMADLVNEVQGRVNEWIKSGGLRNTI